MKSFLLLLVFLSAISFGMEADEANAAREKTRQEWVAHCLTMPLPQFVSLERDGKEIAKPATVAEALSKAKSGDVVVLQKGVYFGDKVNIPTGVTIRGQGDDSIITARCGREYANWTWVTGEDSTVQNVMFGIAVFATRTTAGTLWLEDVGNAIEIRTDEIADMHKKTGQAQRNIVRLFGHAMTQPADPNFHANFYVAYPKYLDYGTNEAYSYSNPWVVPFQGYEKDVTGDYEGKMPVLPRRRAEKFLKWLAAEPQNYQAMDAHGRKVISRLIQYVQKKYPDIESPINVAVADDFISKAKAALANKHPITARFFIEKADGVTIGMKEVELDKLRAETLSKGLGRIACSFEATNDGTAENLDHDTYKRNRFTKPLQEKLLKRFPILRMAGKLDPAAGCGIKISADEDLKEQRSNTASGSYTTWVETEASKQQRAAEARMAEAEARAAEKAATQAAQARLDTMVANAKTTMQSMYEGRTRIEQRGNSTYVVSSRDKDPGAVGRSNTTAARNAEEAARNAQATRAQVGKADKGATAFEEKKVYTGVYNMNYEYRYNAQLEVLDKNKPVLNRKTPPTRATWSVTGCKDSSDSFQHFCGNRMAGPGMAHTEDSFKQNVETPLTLFLTVRLGNIASESLKAAEKKKNDDDKFESLLQAYFVGAPITDTDLEPYTEKALGEKLALADISQIILK